MDANRQADETTLASRKHGSQGAGLRAVGLAVSRVATPAIARRGGGTLVRLKTHWAEIAGAPWGDLTWPTGLGRDGALKLRVAPTAALELQHRAALLIERINTFFGRPAVARLALVQGPLPLAPHPAPAPPAPLAAAAAQAIEERVAPVGDSALREALARLGRAVATAGR